MELQKDEKRKLDDEPQPSSSKKAKTSTEESAFCGYAESTTVDYTWAKNCSYKKDYPDKSATFGSKKALFYLSLKRADDELDCDDDYYKEHDYEYPMQKDEIYLHLHKSSIIKKIYISSLLVDSKPLKNDVLTTETPIKLKDIFLVWSGHCKKWWHDGFYVKVKIIFKESVDGWNSHGSFAVINHAELLCQQMANVTNSIPSDVTLKTMVDEQLFTAHKFILKMRSPVFATMFSGDFLENQEKKPVEIFEISGRVMEALLAYIYCKPFDGWKMIAGELAVAADMYNIQPLYDACINSLLADITVENAAKNFYYAHLLNSPNVNEIARFISDKKKEVILTDDWMKINMEHDDLLGQQLLKILPEESEKDDKVYEEKEDKQVQVKVEDKKEKDDDDEEGDNEDSEDEDNSDSD